MDAVNQAVVEVERDVERHAAGLLAVFSPCHAWNGIINFEIALRDEARDREPRQAGEIDERIQLFHLTVEKIHLPGGLFLGLTAEFRHIAAVRQCDDHEGVASGHKVGAAGDQLVHNVDAPVPDAHPECLDLLHGACHEVAQRIVERKPAFVGMRVEIRHVQLEADGIEWVVAGGEQVVDLLAVPCGYVNAFHRCPP